MKDRWWPYTLLITSVIIMTMFWTMVMVATPCNTVWIVGRGVALGLLLVTATSIACRLARPGKVITCSLPPEGQSGLASSR